MNFYVLGDLHGGYDQSLVPLSTKKFPEQKNMTKETDILFQLGDFGFLWFYPEYNKREYEKDLKKINELLKRNFLWFVIPGNHENYDLLDRLPEKELFNGTVKYLSLPAGEIYFAKRGEIYEIDGKKIFTFSGAKSNDIEDRFSLDDFLNKKEYYKYSFTGGFSKKRKNVTPNKISYWKQEVFSEEEKNFALKNLEKHNYKIDYVFTHTGPSSALKEMTLHKGKINCPVAIFLDEIKEKLTFKEWHFGHIHTNKNYLNFYSHYLKSPHLIKN